MLNHHVIKIQPCEKLGGETPSRRNLDNGLKWLASLSCQFIARETATHKPVNLDEGWTGPRAVAGYGDKEKNLEIYLDKGFV